MVSNFIEKRDFLEFEVELVEGADGEGTRCAVFRRNLCSREESLLGEWRESDAAVAAAVEWS